jgi:hypothetical protein
LKTWAKAFPDPRREPEEDVSHVLGPLRGYPEIGLGKNSRLLG